MTGSGLTLRRGNPEDADACGQICHDAFAEISARHNFPKDMPSPEVASGLLSGLLSHPECYSVVAEREGVVVGSNFLDERSTIFGVGPITIAPTAQDSGIGRSLMQDVLARANERQAAGVRLLQDAFHNRSFTLDAKLGFRPARHYFSAAGAQNQRGDARLPCSRGQSSRPRCLQSAV